MKIVEKMLKNKKAFSFMPDTFLKMIILFASLVLVFFLLLAVTGKGSSAIAFIQDFIRSWGR